MSSPQPPGPYGPPYGQPPVGTDTPDVTIPQQRGGPSGGWAVPPGAAPQGYRTDGYPAPQGYRTDGYPAPAPQGYGTDGYPAPAPQGYGTGGYPVPGAPGAGYGAPGYGPPPGYGPATTQLPGQGGAPPWGGGAPPPPFQPPRRRFPIIVAIVAVVALILGGVVVYTQFFSRGADSPAESAQLLAAELADGDMTGALSRLHPAELDLITDSRDIFVPELVRLGVFKQGADPSAGGTITAKDLQFDPNPEMVVPDKVAILKLTGGTITVRSDPAQSPFTDSFKSRVFPNGVPQADENTIDIAREVARQREPIRVASVNVDGDWYVSVFYTIADYGLKESGTPWPQTAITPNGGANAQDALEQTVQALLQQNGRRLIELAPPGELSVLHDVGNAIPTSQGRAASYQITELETTQTTVDGQTALSINKVVIKDAQGRGGSVTRSGNCLVLQESGGRSSQQQICPEDFLRNSFGSSASRSPEAMRAATAIMQALLDVKIVVVEDGGKWYVSPTRTGFALYASVLRALQPGDIEALIDAGMR